MYLSKSKYCNAVQCKKMLWLNEYKPEEKESLNAKIEEIKEEEKVLDKEEKEVNDQIFV